MKCLLCAIRPENMTDITYLSSDLCILVISLTDSGDGKVRSNLTVYKFQTTILWLTNKEIKTNTPTLDFLYHVSILSV